MDKEEIKGAAFVWVLVFTACMLSSFGTWWFLERNTQEPSPVTNPVSAFVVSDEPYIVPDPCGLDVVLCPGENGYDQKMLENKIRMSARSFGIDADVAVAIAQCESSLMTDAVNAKSGAMGLYQFLPSTWSYIGEPGSAFDEDDAIDAFMRWYPENKSWWECE